MSIKQMKTQTWEKSDDSRFFLKSYFRKYVRVKMFFFLMLFCVGCHCGCFYSALHLKFYRLKKICNSALKKKILCVRNSNDEHTKSVYSNYTLEKRVSSGVLVLWRYKFRSLSCTMFIGSPNIYYTSGASKTINCFYSFR